VYCLQQKIILLNSNDYNCFEDINSEIEETELLFNEIYVEFQKYLPSTCFIFPQETKEIIKRWKSITISYEYFEYIQDQCFKIIFNEHKIILSPLIKELGKECFSEYSSLTTINLPSTLQSLGNWCFYFCSSLTTINLPSTLQSLGDECFSWCSSLTTIYLPSTLQSLGNECFSKCSSLKSINHPSSLLSVGKDCFISCSNLPKEILNHFKQI
jgi:hypothetical protein